MRWRQSDRNSAAGTRRASALVKPIQAVVAIGLVGFASFVYFESADRNRVAKEAPVLAYRSLFKPLPLDCDPGAKGRKEVMVRDLVFAPIVSEHGLVREQAMRSAMGIARHARKEWQSGADYETLRARYTTVAPAAPPDSFVSYTLLPSQVALAAFCLPLRAISPPMLEADGFHLVQVVEAR